MKRVGLATCVVLWFLLCGLVAIGQTEPDASARRSTPTATSLIDLTPDANGKLSQGQMQQLFRVVADKDTENDKRLRDYTYIERDEEHKLDGKGQTKSTKSETYEVMELYGEQAQRLIEKDGKALSPKDAAKEEEKIQKIIDKRKSESEDAHRKREQKEEKEREEGRQFVHEIADAYNFHLVGTESLGGRDAWVIDAEPRPGYEPHMKYAKFLPKFRGRVWIDKEETQWAKMDIQCIDTVSLGLFLARFHKGSRIVVEQTRVNDEVWVPKHVNVKVDVRLALVKNFNVEEEQTFRDYKKFRATARIVGVGEVKEQ
ncbi:MAG TPA: hypothetical protein VFF64_18380 [Candidatus Eremiobacteraceae bacterium]|nr:hypothetical protein [Candidatus Eremiobacteraceae bacterium]